MTTNETTRPTDSEIDDLARYNAERWRGITHTPETVERMAVLQRRYDAWITWPPDGYTTREEWLEDRRVAALARMTWWQRLRRWWWIHWPAVLTLTALVAAIVVIWWLR